MTFYDKKLNKEINLDPVPVVSSNIATLAYDKDNNVLQIEFLGGGIYRYYGVLDNIYEQALAQSKLKAEGSKTASVGHYLYSSGVTGRGKNKMYEFVKIE